MHDHASNISTCTTPAFSFLELTHNNALQSHTEHMQVFYEDPTAHQELGQLLISFAQTLSSGRCVSRQNPRSKRWCLTVPWKNTTPSNVVKEHQGHTVWTSPYLCRERFVVVSWVSTLQKSCLKENLCSQYRTVIMWVKQDLFKQL